MFLLFFFFFCVQITPTQRGASYSEWPRSSIPNCSSLAMLMFVFSPSSSSPFPLTFCFYFPLLISLVFIVCPAPFPLRAFVTVMCEDVHERMKRAHCDCGTMLLRLKALFSYARTCAHTGGNHHLVTRCRPAASRLRVQLFCFSYRRRTSPCWFFFFSESPAGTAPHQLLNNF